MKAETIEKIKHRSLGTFFNTRTQRLGYVMEKGYDNNSMCPGGVFYRVIFLDELDKSAPLFMIEFEEYGIFTPWQDTLFTYPEK